MSIHNFIILLVVKYTVYWTFNYLRKKLKILFSQIISKPERLVKSFSLKNISLKEKALKKDLFELIYFSWKFHQ